MTNVNLPITNISVPLEIAKVVDNIAQNRYYKLSEADSTAVRADYYSRLNMSNVEATSQFYNKAGTLVAVGFARVVIGDYGAYLEFAKDNIKTTNIENKWPGVPSRPVKYIWMVTKDKEQTKVYYQQQMVAYADYKPDMYYVSPADLYVNNQRLYIPFIEGVV